MEDDYELTSEELNALATEAARKARISAMEIMGYVIEAKDNWVVRVDKDGTVTKIKPIKQVLRTKPYPWEYNS